VLLTLQLLCPLAIVALNLTPFVSSLPVSALLLQSALLCGLCAM
jgi:hypothetical protein